MHEKDLDRLRGISWRNASPPRRLSLYGRAPKKPGIYELGLSHRGAFQPRYIGVAADQNLVERLEQHFRKSSNEHALRLKPRVWYRCIPTSTSEDALVLEAHYQAAFRDTRYLWNRKTEWWQMFALHPEASFVAP